MLVFSVLAYINKTFKKLTKEVALSTDNLFTVCSTQYPVSKFLQFRTFINFPGELVIWQRPTQPFLQREKQLGIDFSSAVFFGF